MNDALFVDPEAFEGLVIGDFPPTAGTILANRTGASAPPSISARGCGGGCDDSQNLAPYAQSARIRDLLLGRLVVFGKRRYHCGGRPLRQTDDTLCSVSMS